MSIHNMFLSRNKKIIMWIPPLIRSYENIGKSRDCVYKIAYEYSVYLESVYKYLHSLSVCCVLASASYLAK